LKRRAEKSGTADAPYELIQQGADVHAQDEEGETSLILAVEFPERFELLLKVRNLHVQNTQTWTKMDANY
jgi:ankyrin repeat protein